MTVSWVSIVRPTDAPAAQTGYGPWVGGGLVPAELRGQGIGARLLAAMDGEARRLGFTTIYCSTRGARRLLERCGWESIGTITHDGAPLRLPQGDMSGASSHRPPGGLLLVTGRRSER